jgi:hypothetical protein
MLKSIVLAAGFLALHPGPPPSTPQLCQADLPRNEGQVSAWVNLLVEEGSYRPVSLRVFVRHASFDAEWRLDGQGMRARNGMAGFTHRLPLGASTRYPVTVKFSTQGRPLGEARLTGQGSPRITAAMLPNLYGLRSLTLKTVDARGAQLAVETLPRPDWAWLEREAGKAARSAEAKRKRRACVASVVY